MIISVATASQVARNSPAMCHDVLVLPLPVIGGKSLERVFMNGRIKYQVRETFDCLADAVTLGGTTPRPMAKSLAFAENELYPLDWLESNLAGIMSLQVFLTNLGLQRTGQGRMYQYALWGREILQAVANAEQAANQKPATNVIPQVKRGRPRKYK